MLDGKHHDASVAVRVAPFIQGREDHVLNDTRPFSLACGDVKKDAVRKEGGMVAEQVLQILAMRAKKSTEVYVGHVETRESLAYVLVAKHLPESHGESVAAQTSDGVC
jgi:hypothetical protein